MNKNWRRATVITSLLLLNATCSNAQRVIKGRILSKDSIPVSEADVSVKNTLLRNITDANGYFLFNNIKEQQLTIVINAYFSKPFSQTIQVNNGDTTTLDIYLPTAIPQLNTVRVTSRYSNIKSFSDDIAKMPLSNMENPEVYSTVSKELLKEQNIVNIQDALRNVTGATVNMDPAGGVSIMSRGFSTYVGARNGFPFVASARSNWDLANIEAIEVIKGPSGALFGNAFNSYGGLVNLATKKPFEQNKTEIGYTLGSFGMQRLTADVNAPLTNDKSVLLRVNAAVHKQGSFMNAGHNNRLFLAPSVTFRPTERLKFNLDMELYKEDVTRPYYISNMDTVVKYYGISNIKDLPISYNQAYFDNSLNAVSQNLRTYFLTEYQLSNTWTSATNISYINENLIKSYQGYLLFGSNDSTITRSNGDFGPITTYTTDIQQNFKGDFKIGNFRNRLLIGLDYYNYNSKRIYVSYPALDIINNKRGNFDLANIRQVEKAYNAYAGLSSSAQYGSNYDQLAVYASDLINITDRLMVLASARMDRYMRKGSGSYDQNSVTPKFGIVYQPILDKISLFGNYTSGFTYNFGTVIQPDQSTFEKRPYFARQLEGGVKLSFWNNHLVATASYYSISINDAPRTDNNFYYQDGKQKSKGFEFDLKANTDDGLSITAGYVYNNNKYIKATTNAGKFSTASPQNVANLWLSYRFIHSSGALKHFAIGAGGNYVDKSFYNAANTIILPSYFLANASVFYDIQTWRVGIALSNLTNQKYWTSIATPQPPRNVSLSAAFRF